MEREAWYQGTTSTWRKQRKLKEPASATEADKTFFSMHFSQPSKNGPPLASVRPNSGKRRFEECSQSYGNTTFVFGASTTKRRFRATGASQSWFSSTVAFSAMLRMLR